MSHLQTGFLVFRNAKPAYGGCRADDVLTTENKAPGYTIKFTLKDFILYYAQQTLLFSGFPLFQEMNSTDEKTQRKWKENRMTA